ncbi:uncharacterized protein CPUR_01895 [Claviceps purpurea 20.1]|uniref:Uncharacterized protein n=1 Tax=Claviceps purpurea (strain 20.1) TaxID=1111077 RepID=M1W3E1_CLAP2|nr:uncharacterized protein CPUR_01895 [Claviceps purpurea 20.1]
MPSRLPAVINFGGSCEFS